MRGRNSIPLARQVVQKRIPERRCTKPPRQRFARAAALRKTLDRALALGAKHEFDLPELIGLKSACGLEPRTETQKFEWGHRFEDIELRHHHLEDGEDAFQRV